MQPDIWQILIIAIVVLVLFGRGRISEMMGDFGKGISSFKKGMSEGSNPSPPPPAQITGDARPSADTTAAPAAESAPADKTAH
ncbi:MAG: twin-arginine translocase TatA/TatE family subunit [Alteraurantiacibacter sp.]|nr:twin-arginine translocase TatA/TatE family subunit [Alteraurantiacibacter sp.]